MGSLMAWSTWSAVAAPRGSTIPAMPWHNSPGRIRETLFSFPRSAFPDPAAKASCMVAPDVLLCQIVYCVRVGLNPPCGKTLLQTPGALDALSSLLDSGVDAWGAREYAAIIIGNCGANSEEGAELIVKHSGVMSSLISCLLNSREVRMQETIVVAVKNCAASSQEAAFVVAQSDKALALLKKLALQDIQPRLQYVVLLHTLRFSPFFLRRNKARSHATHVLTGYRSHQQHITFSAGSASAEEDGVSYRCSFQAVEVQEI